MTYFVAYPVTPAMGLRESINAMLAHVAYNGRPFGHLPSALHLSNYNALLEDFTGTVIEANDTLALAPVITDSMELASLVDTLESLCNHYPAYDEDGVFKIEQDRILDTINDTRTETDPAAEDIAHALFAIGADIEQSEYGADFSGDDYAKAVELARELNPA